MLVLSLSIDISNKEWNNFETIRDIVYNFFEKKLIKFRSSTTDLNTIAECKLEMINREKCYPYFTKILQCNL